MGVRTGIGRLRLLQLRSLRPATGRGLSRGRGSVRSSGTMEIFRRVRRSKLSDLMPLSRLDVGAGVASGGILPVSAPRLEG